VSIDAGHGVSPLMKPDHRRDHKPARPVSI
jgi:hypothetical protein